MQTEYRIEQNMISTLDDVDIFCYLFLLLETKALDHVLCIIIRFDQKWF